MKKLKVISMAIMLILMMTIPVLAADEIAFTISYDGTVKVGETKDVLIVLAGNDAPVYTNVVVKVDITGPATPTFIATDSLGTEIDIAQTGYWGPETGFAIAGTFSNETPVKATFSEAGNYTITLSLLNVADNNSVITTKSITVDVVSETQTPTTNTIVNTTVNTTVNTIVNNTVEELPKTGTSLMEYVMYSVVMISIIYMVYRIRQRNG